MGGSLEVTELKSEDYVFPATVKAPGSDNHLFLGGAGVRGLEIEGKFVKFTTMAMYLEESAIEALSAKWKGKTAHELAASEDFYQDIVTGPFEKLLQVTCLVPMPGVIYSSKVSEQCVETWKSKGIYTDKEVEANEKFLDTFKDQMFPPGHSVLFTLSPYASGALTIAFSKHDLIPETGIAVIENKNLVEGITNAAIGKGGVSPEAKKSLADRISQLLNNSK